MSNTTPVPTYNNPIRYRDKWRVYHSDIVMAPPWCFVHDDYDGAPDGHDYRYGYAESIEEAFATIDELEAEHAQ